MVLVSLLIGSCSNYLVIISCWYYDLDSSVYYFNSVLSFKDEFKIVSFVWLTSYLFYWIFGWNKLYSELVLA